MPYSTTGQLPKRVRDHLPDHAQEICLAAFNSAWDQYRDPSKRHGGGSPEETAHRVVWAAVKEKYRKDGATGTWVKRTD